MELVAIKGTAPAVPVTLPINDTGNLLALELFNRLDDLPHQYFVHLQHDSQNAPLIRPGEVVVVDQGGARAGGWLPTEGGLFLIEYRSTDEHWKYPRVARQIVQTYRGRGGRWFASGLRRNGPINGIIHFADGPYPEDGEALADQLIGKVIGLYRPEVVQ